MRAAAKAIHCCSRRSQKNDDRKWIRQVDQASSTSSQGQLPVSHGELLRTCERTCGLRTWTPSYTSFEKKKPARLRGCPLRLARQNPQALRTRQRRCHSSTKHGFCHISRSRLQVWSRNRPSVSCATGRRPSRRPALWLDLFVRYRDCDLAG
jgi:hypothetical protein